MSSNQTTPSWDSIVNAAIQAGQTLAYGILNAVQTFAQPLGFAVVGGLVAAAAMYIGELVVRQATGFISAVRGALGR